MMNDDGRLDRLAALTVLAMEALAGLDSRFNYEIFGHSGETAFEQFVSFECPPRDIGERLGVVRAIYDHASMCQTGDNTINAGVLALKRVTAEPADDYFVFLISDANTIEPSALAQAMGSDPRVNFHSLFIANEAVAGKVRQFSPPGRVHVVMDTRELPMIFKRIFSAAVQRAD